MEHAIPMQLVMVLAVGTLAVALCQRFGLSPILGYLGTGLLVGPAGMGWLSDGETLRMLAELGVVLLLFSIGLEFSLPRLLSAKQLVLGLGSAQVIATALVLGATSLALGIDPIPAAVIGLTLAMSSTTIVLKQLSEQMELPTPQGRVATGILLFQDIAAILILAALPALGGEPDQLETALTLALGKTTLVFLSIVGLGRWALPKALHWVAGTRSLELFMLTALLMAVGAGVFSLSLGLSPGLGAFMAGMLLGETEFRHQVEADIRPFRDLMLGLFFTTIGMQVDPRIFFEQPMAVALVCLAVFVAKPLILVPLVRRMGYNRLDAWRSAITLAQAGEFGLLAIATAASLGLLGDELAQPLLGGMILTMLIAPLILRYNQPVTAWLLDRKQMTLSTEASIATASQALDQHVIICGYGRLGQNLLPILKAEGISALALDLDPQRVRQASAAGETVLYGNAAQPGILSAAGIERARALAITLDDAATSERIIVHVRGRGLDLPILVRSTQGRHDEALMKAGATVFPEGLESSLAFAGQMLLLLDVPHSRVESRLNEIRAQDYAPLRVFFHAAEGEKSAEQALDFPQQIQSFFLAEEHRANGRTPQELQLEALGVELVDVRRGAIRVPGRLLDTRLRPGDVLVLKGDAAALERAIVRLRGED